jgi:hypothetical protein
MTTAEGGAAFCVFATGGRSRGVNDAAFDCAARIGPRRIHRITTFIDRGPMFDVRHHLLTAPVNRFAAGARTHRGWHRLPLARSAVRSSSRGISQ